MLFQVASLVAISGTLVQAWTSTGISATTDFACSTQSGSGAKAPTPIPSTTVEIASTVSAIQPAVTVETTLLVPGGETVTVTDRTATVLAQTIVTVTVPTLTKYETIYSTIGTAVLPSTVCSNGVSPSLVTEYTGAYTPVAGQATALPASYPTLVSCNKRVTSFLGLYDVGTTTLVSTVTQTSHVLQATTTYTATWTLGSSTVNGTTVTSTVTSYKVASTAPATTVACAATKTTTLAAKCAPTNLIGSMDGAGLVSGSYPDAEAIIYAPAAGDRWDASLCCQLCQDNQGCAGMMSGSSGYCALLFVEASNGTSACAAQAFTYQSQKSVMPGQGLVVQSGCGVIEYAGSI